MEIQRTKRKDRRSHADSSDSIEIMRCLRFLLFPTLAARKSSLTTRKVSRVRTSVFSCDRRERRELRYGEESDAVFVQRKGSSKTQREEYPVERRKSNTATVSGLPDSANRDKFNDDKRRFSLPSWLSRLVRG